MTSIKKVLEFHPNESISLPIVKFPPFKLRAALVEKDPVVWAHLLETYITYVQYLLEDARLDKLDEVTSDQLIIFIRTYLHEMAEEEGKLLSLGMNLEVTKHLNELRSWIFVLIRTCGLLHLQIFSETLWDLIKLYVNEFPDTVRGLINGKLQPAINTQKANLNKIYQVQQHIRHLLEGGKFSRVDLKTLEVLLSRDKGKKETSFADEFLTREWSELLEALSIKSPQSALEDWCKKLAILTFLCASEDRLVSLLEELGISKPDALGRYLLIGSLLLSHGFKKRFPGLPSRVSFLRLLEHADDAETLTANSNLSVLFTDEEKAAVIDLFPTITEQQLTLLFSEYGSLDVVIDVLLDDPSMLERMPTSAVVEVGSMDKHPKRKELSESDRIQRMADTKLSHVPDEIRNKTLNRALQLLYSNYEDERDDTYDEADATKPSAERIEVDDVSSKEKSTYNEIEEYLWDMLKKDKTLFERRQRGTSGRKELKKTTTWSDEQIEGWARMLERSPQRAQLLEEKFMFRGNVRTGKTSYVKSKGTATNSTAKKGSVSTVLSLRDQKQAPRLVKSKSTRGTNHNRKEGHAKKLNRATGA